MTSIQLRRGLLLVAMVLLASGCEEASTTAQAPPRIGETYHAVKDGWDIVLTSAKSGPLSSGVGAYVNLHVEAVNTGKEAHKLGNNRFKRRDSQERAWKDVLTETVGALANLGLETIQPGFSTKLDLSFKVPSGAKGLWFERRQWSLLGPLPASHLRPVAARRPRNVCRATDLREPDIGHLEPRRDLLPRL
jgi:hypothetical protein